MCSHLLPGKLLFQLIHLFLSPVITKVTSNNTKNIINIQYKPDDTLIFWDSIYINFKIKIYEKNRAIIKMNTSTSLTEIPLDV